MIPNLWVPRSCPLLRTRAGFLVGVFLPKGSPRVSSAVFLSGNRAPTEFRDGNGRHLHSFRMIRICLIMSNLRYRYYWPPWCKTNR
jgi:hypothetical protein